MPSRGRSGAVRRARCLWRAGLSTKRLLTGGVVKDAAAGDDRLLVRQTVQPFFGM